MGHPALQGASAETDPSTARAMLRKSMLARDRLRRFRAGEPRVAILIKGSLCPSFASPHQPLLIIERTAQTQRNYEHAVSAARNRRVAMRWGPCVPGRNGSARHIAAYSPEPGSPSTVACSPVIPGKSRRCRARPACRWGIYRRLARSSRRTACRRRCACKAAGRTLCPARSRSCRSVPRGRLPLRCGGRPPGPAALCAAAPEAPGLLRRCS
mmetsp:Transcript_139/g.520  ORF Transcript_139/g.520 Transcript_139/m.520 type:complete len:212 (+) Transcript_139:301-936(+)